MKILAFVDTHLHKKAIETIKKHASEVDILICAGDISWFGIGLKEVLGIVDKIGKPVYIIPGNHEDPPDKLEKAIKGLKNVHYAHQKIVQIGEFTFFFWGCGGFAHINKPFERAMEKFKQSLKGDEKIVLVTHGPPYGTVLDLLSWAGHVGCVSERRFLRELKPVLHICGHLHENIHKQQVIYKKTLVVNPGPAGMIIEL